MPDYLTIILGGLIAFITTWLVNSWLRSRQEAFEVLKIVSTAAPLYTQLARYAWNFSWSLEHASKKDDYYESLMWNISNVLYIKTLINQKFGDLQFDSLTAERVIAGIGGRIFSILGQKFSALEYSKISYLVEDNIPFHKFHENIYDDDNSKQLYSKFEKWLSHEITNDDRIALEKSCAWYSQLIMFELNNVYKIMYSEQPSLTLRDDLSKYLLDKEPDYYKRIHKLASNIHSKLERKK